MDTTLEATVTVSLHETEVATQAEELQKISSLNQLSPFNFRLGSPTLISENLLGRTVLGEYAVWEHAVMLFLPLANNQI